MRPIILVLLLGVCVVAQETNDRIEYYKFINSQHGNYDLRFKTNNGIERGDTRNSRQIGGYGVIGLYSYITPNNQQVKVFYSPTIQGFQILPPPESYPTLPLPLMFNWYQSERAKVTSTQKPNGSNELIKPSSTSVNQFNKLQNEETHVTTTENNIEDYFKFIFKPKSYYENVLEIPIIREDCTDKISLTDTFLTRIQDVSIVKMHDNPFGKGPDELAKNRAMLSKNRLRSNINNINNNYYKLSRTKFLQSAIGPRFEDV